MPTKPASRWLSLYIGGVILAGFGLVVLAIFFPPEDRIGLLIFAVLAVLAQLGDVELFANSRSRVSVSSIIIISSVVLFGPLSGAVAHMVVGFATLITTTLRSQQPANGRMSWLRRTAFNTSMLGVSSACAGYTYILLGGQVGDILHWGNLFPLFATAVVDTLVNIGLLIGVIALQTGQKPWKIWEQNFQWAAPIAILGGILGGGTLALAYTMFNILGLAVFSLPILAISYSFQVYINRTRKYIEDLQVMNTRLEQANLDLEKANLNLEKANLGLLEALSAAVDAYDAYTYGHSIQVAKYAAAIAEKMGYPDEDQALIFRAGLIHDVGKIGISESIVGKRGRVSKEEYDILKKHPVIGAEILSRTEGFQNLIPIVKHHHERWDGLGYPDGLRGDEIPLGAQILNLADSLEAMLSDRPYNPTRTLEDVAEEVHRCTNFQFSPDVAQAFFELVEEKGASFFKNSAEIVDEDMELRGFNLNGEKLRYLKKGSLMSQLSRESEVTTARVKG